MSTTSSQISSSIPNITSNVSAKKTAYQNLLKRLRRIEIAVSSVCIFGIFVCLYVLKVEIYKERDKNYKAFCDFSEYFSCSKVFSSKYGKGFGLFQSESILNQPNSIYGIIFYIFQLLCLLMRNNMFASKLRIILSIMSNAGSVYLAYILYFVLHDFCIVCVTTYIINFILLLLNINNHKYQRNLKNLQQSKKQN